MEAVKAGEAGPRFAALVNGINAPAMQSESQENGKTKVRRRFLQQALARRGMAAQCIITSKAAPAGPTCTPRKYRPGHRARRRASLTR